MNTVEELRRYLIYILKNYDVYYITKQKVEREVYSLDFINHEIDEESKMINKLFAIKNNEIRVNGVASDNIETLLSNCLNDITYLCSQKRKGNYLDIKDDDTLENIANKIKVICNDEDIDIKGHKLSEEEEKILEESSVERLKKARKKGIEEERKYIKELYKDTLEKRKQNLIDMGLIYDKKETSKKTYELRNARKKGIKEESKYLRQK